MTDRRQEQEAVEELARVFHAIYQAEAKRQGDVRHHDDYDQLPENVKEFDRVLARHVLAEVSRLETEMKHQKVAVRDLSNTAKNLREALARSGTTVSRLETALAAARADEVIEAGVADEFREQAVAAEAALAAAREALEDAAEPVMDSKFRARLLRHGLSNEEIAEFVDAVESQQLRARWALSGVVPSGRETTTDSAAVAADGEQETPAGSGGEGE